MYLVESWTEWRASQSHAVVANGRGRFKVAQMTHSTNCQCGLLSLNTPSKHLETPLTPEERILWDFARGFHIGLRALEQRCLVCGGKPCVCPSRPKEV